MVGMIGDLLLLLGWYVLFYPMCFMGCIVAGSFAFGLLAEILSYSKTIDRYVKKHTERMKIIQYGLFCGFPFGVVVTKCEEHGKLIELLDKVLNN